MPEQAKNVRAEKRESAARRERKASRPPPDKSIGFLEQNLLPIKFFLSPNIIPANARLVNKSVLPFMFFFIIL